MVNTLVFELKGNIIHGLKSGSVRGKSCSDSVGGLSTALLFSTSLLYQASELDISCCHYTCVPIPLAHSPRQDRQFNDRIERHSTSDEPDKV